MLSYHSTSKFGQAAFSIRGCQLRNTLATDIELISDMKIFYNKGEVLAKTKPVKPLKGVCFMFYLLEAELRTMDGN